MKESNTIDRLPIGVRLVIIAVLLFVVETVCTAATNEQYQICTRCGNLELDLSEETAVQAEKALIKCRQYAEKGSAVACLTLGIRYVKGWGVERDYHEAKKWFHKASAKEDENELNIKSTLSSFGIETDFASSQEVAYYNLGVMAVKGWGMKKDLGKAFVYFCISAEYGFREAQVIAGDMFANGIGGAMNAKKAVEWYRKAAKQGDVTAKSRIIDMEKQSEK